MKYRFVAHIIFVLEQLLNILKNVTVLLKIVLVRSKYTMQWNTTQRNATQRNATQHNTTQRNATQHNATQRNATQRNAVKYNTSQHNATQYDTMQHNTIQTMWCMWCDRLQFIQHDSVDYNSMWCDTVQYLFINN